MIGGPYSLNPPSGPPAPGQNFSQPMYNPNFLSQMLAYSQMQQ